MLRGEDKARKRPRRASTSRKKLAHAVASAEKAVARRLPDASRTSIGLHGYHLPDMDEVAETAHEYYNNHLRGGEGHMEVGKLILNVAKTRRT